MESVVVVLFLDESIQALKFILAWWGGPENTHLAVFNEGPPEQANIRWRAGVQKDLRLRK